MSASDKTPAKCMFYIFSTFYPAERSHDKNFKKRTTIDETDKEERDVDLIFLKDFIQNQKQGHDLEYKYFQNRTKKQMETVFESIIEKDKIDNKLKQYDCYIFVFLTFMSKENDNVEKIHYRDKKVPIDDIWKKISGIKAMIGKPKILLVQADDVALLEELGYHKGPGAKPKIIPTDADRLAIVSTIPARGYVKDNAPSFLIQAFVEEVTRNNEKAEEEKLDLLSLTTKINSNVSGMISKSKEEKLTQATELKMLQIPCTTSTLTQLVYI